MYRVHRLRYLAVAVVFGIASMLVIVPAKVHAFASGNGTQASPYKIANCSQLQAMNDALSAYYELANDIDCSVTENWNGGAGFLPIGNWDEPFMGELNGKGYAVSNLFVDTTDEGNSNVPGGMFGQIGEREDQQGLVKDFGLEDINIKGGWSTGGLVGVLYGQANNTYTTGQVNGTGELGGLVGSHGGIWDTVINSWSSATVTGSQLVGGLVGFNAENANIINSYATGDVSGSGNFIGGLVGYNDGNIEKAHATGNAYSESSIAGGLVGRNDGSIARSYATGNTQAIADYAGGLVGHNVGLIEISYSSNDVAEGGGVFSECVAGGLVALNSAEGEIRNAYSTSSSNSSGCDSGSLVGVNWGSVMNTYATGTSSAAAFVAYAMPSSDNWTSFWDTQTTGSTTACDYEDDGVECDGFLRFEGRTTAQMHSITTYTDDLSEGAWDFETIWSIDPSFNNGYPYFAIVGATPVDQPEVEQPTTEVEIRDVNGDGIDDGEQNIVAFRSSFTNKIMALELSDECEFEVGIRAESEFAAQDVGYNYPENFIGFNADCGTPGFTTTVKQYYYDHDPTGLVARKHNPSTNAYFTIPGATIEKTTINGHTVSKVTFTVTDGGLLDVDGIANGSIIDPAGLAEAVIGVPNTGFAVPVLPKQ